MADEPDGVDEAFEGHLRVALTVAGLAAEHAARTRERAARNAEAASQQEARELRARMDAERSAARASLAPVEREEWWAKAGPEDVAAAWETAQAWSDLDPDARRIAYRIRKEVRERYGVDVDDARPEPGALRDALDARGAADREAQRHREEARRDDIEAAQLMGEADRADRADRSREPVEGAVAGQEGRDLYDTAERRRDLAAGLEGVADAETVQARVLADTNQARPAAEAVASAPGKAPKARRHRGPAGRAKEQQKTLSR
jgi:hypothetical protein